MLQTEARFAVVNQIGGPVLFFPGAYVTASYLMTGESHPYDRKHGIFRQPIPHRDFELGRGGGAWELALGWAFIDLDDQNVAGGQGQTFTLGMNWYLHRYMKIQLNLIHAILDDPLLGNSDVDIASLRAQVEF